MSRRLVCLVLLTCLLAQAPAMAVATETPERTAFALVNRARERNDARALRLAVRLARHAERQSRRMVRRRALFHSSLDIDGFSALGECVGMGDSVRDVHRAFMHSPAHRSIVLGRWRYVGIGVLRSRGLVYVTEVFAR